MYAFNLENPEKAKMYIWITNMFAYSSERDGFVIDGHFEVDSINKYKNQYESIIDAAKNDGGEIKTYIDAEQLKRNGELLGDR